VNLLSWNLKFRLKYIATFSLFMLFLYCQLFFVWYLLTNSFLLHNWMNIPFMTISVSWLLLIWELTLEFYTTFDGGLSLLFPYYTDVAPHDYSSFSVLSVVLYSFHWYWKHLCMLLVRNCVNKHEMGEYFKLKLLQFWTNNLIYNIKFGVWKC